MIIDFYWLFDYYLFIIIFDDYWLFFTIIFLSTIICFYKLLFSIIGLYFFLMIIREYCCLLTITIRFDSLLPIFIDCY